MLAYKAITTKYLSPTNYRGSRVKATDGYANSLTLGWDDALGSRENHAAAAKALAQKMGWTGAWIMGGLPGVYVFVLVSGADGFVIEEESGV